MKGLALNPNAAIEERYYQAMCGLIHEMTHETQREIKKLFARPVAQEFFAQDDTMSGQAKLVMARLYKTFDKVFNIAARPLAETMTRAESASSAGALQSSLKKLSAGLTLKTDILTGELHDILKATIHENVGLIKSIPHDYLNHVEGAVMRSITTGNGLQDLVPFLKDEAGVTLRRARVIARDQTRKAFSNINAARMEKVGIQQYEWLHSAGGQKPRRLHQQMSGKIYSLANPPIIQEGKGAQREIRGKPGDLINCRCRMVPVIRFASN